MIVTRTRSELAQALGDVRVGGASLALVPTMGHLHRGHLSLVDQAAEYGDVVAVSIFVNPLQFGPSEDLEQYPRDEARDLTLLGERNVGLVFLPSDSEMYPDGEPRVTVSAGPLESRLCGAFRPGHFRGVLTVVGKLFGLLRPDVAVFGRKDLQQAILIRRMVHDLNMGVRVELGDIVREADGLAMSSRNVYLRPEERKQATALSAALFASKRLYAAGERRAATLLAEIDRHVVDHDLVELQYAEAVDPETLEPVETVSRGAVLALAAFCGATRLIDNVVL